MSKKYRIYVSGYEGGTIIEKELTKDELKIIQLVASKVTEASEYSRMPMMFVEEITEANEYSCMPMVFHVE